MGARDHSAETTNSPEESVGQLSSPKTWGFPAVPAHRPKRLEMDPQVIVCCLWGQAPHEVLRPIHATCGRGEGPGGRGVGREGLGISHPPSQETGVSPHGKPECRMEWKVAETWGKFGMWKPGIKNVLQIWRKKWGFSVRIGYTHILWH